MDDDLGRVRRAALELAAPLLRERTVILTGSAARSKGMARFFADAGSRPVSLAIDRDEAEARARFAAYDKTLACPSDETRKRFDVIDPVGTAWVYAGSFTAVQSVCGRRVIGARTPEQMAMERKDVQHQLLDSAGQLVDLDDGLTQFRGPVVVRGIPDAGIAMATSHTYLIPPGAPRDRVTHIATELRRDCTSAVVGYLDSGTPCTFYGFATSDTVYDFGPVEALVYWDPQTWRVHAPGIVRPLPMTEDTLAAARAKVQATAMRVHRASGYIGAFGTDGAMVDTDHVIHEINPRMCAGFSLFNQLGSTAAPLAAIDLVLRERAAASATLTEQLAALSAAFGTDRTAAYALWDKGPVIPAQPPDPVAWARQVRYGAAPSGLIPLQDLKERVA